MRIEPNDEDAGVIFDTINGKTTPLRQFDHLRNSIFIRMPTRQGPFLKRHWEPAEAALAHVSYSSLRNQPQDQFLYEYLISLGETSTTTGTLHRVFMERVIEKIGFDVTGDSERKFESQFAVPLAREAQLYPLAVGVRTSTRIAGKEIALPAAEAVLIADLMALSGGPPVPLVLRYLRSWEVGKLTNVELRARLMLIQSFVVRMMLHGDNLSPLRAGFISIAGSLPDDSDESLELALKQHGWRADRDIVDSVATVSLTGHYSSAAVMVVLRGIERQLSGRGAHAVPFGKGEELFSIEHVLPQAQDPGRAWRQDLDKWGEPVDLPSSQELRHTLGNLTAVTNYDNSVNGQKPFSVKRGLIAKTAPLRLHSSFKRRQKWTSKEIVERTQALAVAALAHWRGPRQR